MKAVNQAMLSKTACEFTTILYMCVCFPLLLAAVPFVVRNDAVDRYSELEHQFIEIHQQSHKCLLSSLLHNKHNNQKYRVIFFLSDVVDVAPVAPAKSVQYRLPLHLADEQFLNRVQSFVSACFL